MSTVTESTSPDGEPITHDDLIDFHQALYDDAAFREALDTIEGSTT